MRILHIYYILDLLSVALSVALRETREVEVLTTLFFNIHRLTPRGTGEVEAFTTLFFQNSKTDTWRNQTGVGPYNFALTWPMTGKPASYL